MIHKRIAMHRSVGIVALLAALSCLILGGSIIRVEAQASASWYMLAANPERTSWVAEEVRGDLDPVWYRPIEPFVHPKVQIVAAYGLLYLSTARGLYALDADDGDIAWVYPTELPLGHSPTVVDGVLYVGGYDRRIHALEANPDLASLPVNPATGYRINNGVLWTFDEARAGFETNPLVVAGKLYAGNRDGTMYALDPHTGSLLWKFKTDGPILFSAAYKGDMLYFASDDGHAYALNAQSGALIWKSAKLPGAGFHSWWPVVYEDWVVFAGSYNYLTDDTLSMPDALTFHQQELRDVYTKQGVPAGEYVGPTGTEPGDWAAGTMTIDASRVTNYYEGMPWRRTYFVLDRFSGEELTFDSDNDGRAEYPPILWSGSTHSGNRYPPVLGSDGVLYQHNNYVSDEWIARGHVSGWKFATPFISVISEHRTPIDELQAVSAGGDLVYYSHWESEAGAFDVTEPVGTADREWRYYSYDLSSVAPGYNSQYVADQFYGDPNGLYGGPQNPPIPYQGRIYWHVSNGLLAFGASTGSPNQLPLAKTVSVQDAPPVIPVRSLEQELEAQVQKVIDAGHLRPGYLGTGLGDVQMGYNLGYLSHYFHNPADTIYALTRALPHLSSALQVETRAYLQQEFAAYPPYSVAHIGWRDGAPRETFVTMPEVEERMASFAPKDGIWNSAWDFPQYSFYGLWKYAEVFGGAKEIFDRIRYQLETPPSDSYLAEYPWVHNGYIAGYIGYLELQKMAGELQSPSVRTELNRLLSLRAANFTKDTPYTDIGDYRKALNAARNFIYLVPELGDYLRENALGKVQGAIDEYNRVVPFWFVSKFDTSFSESKVQHLYDPFALFQARSLILKEPYPQLVKYLDVPAFATGDLFYIENLVTAIEASANLYFVKTVSPIGADRGDQLAYSLAFFGTGELLALVDLLPPDVGVPTDLEIDGTSTLPTYDADQHRLLWSDIVPAGQPIAIRYSVTVNTSLPKALVNVADLSCADGSHATTETIAIANPFFTHFPVILRDSLWIGRW